MIEAVNSSLASTQVLRANVEQVSASRSIADSTAPVAVDHVAEIPKAPYISPYIAIDTANNKAVIQIRDSDTGDVQDQFPSQSRLAQLSQQRARQENTIRNTSTPAPEQVRDNSPAPQTTDIITVQDVTSAQPSNASLPSPQAAAAAFSAVAQSSAPASSAGVSVFV